MSNVTVVTSAGNINVTTARDVLSAAPSGWDDQIAEYGRGANYQTQTGGDAGTIYRVGDDASIESSVFLPVRVSNSLKVKNSLVDFFTLGNTNEFGNTDRFTDINGLQVYGDNYVIDNFTGYGIYKVRQTGLNWNGFIDAALAATFAGFSDWFLPNEKQFKSIINLESSKILSYSPFSDNTFSTYFTSTTDRNVTTQCWAISYLNTTSANTKTLTNRFAYYFRKHF